VFGKRSGQPSEKKERRELLQHNQKERAASRGQGGVQPKILGEGGRKLQIGAVSRMEEIIQIPSSEQGSYGGLMGGPRGDWDAEKSE